MDGQPEKLSTEASKYIDHYIYQAYWERSTAQVLRKINQPHLENWERKTIITVEFEQGWQTGGVDEYTSVRPEINAYPEGRQILIMPRWTFPTADASVASVRITWNTTMEIHLLTNGSEKPCAWEMWFIRVS